MKPKGVDESSMVADIHVIKIEKSVSRLFNYAYQFFRPRKLEFSKF